LEAETQRAEGAFWRQFFGNVFGPFFLFLLLVAHEVGPEPLQVRSLTSPRDKEGAFWRITVV
jgi:hypothetical protein